MAISANINKQEFKVGDTVRVFQEFTVAGKTHSQYFQGMVISIKGRGNGKSFTVRKIGADGIGVEKIWPVNSPTVTNIKIRKKGTSRRAKLYYLRHRTGKKSLQVKGKKNSR